MAARPNILFIMADDHASKAISCYGANINHTPHLDRLAKEGMRFNHCYVTNSICTPSRASILTGTYNHVNGVLTLNSKINKHIPNLAKHLRTGGYQRPWLGSGIWERVAITSPVGLTIGPWYRAKVNTMILSCMKLGERLSMSRDTLQTS